MIDAMIETHRVNGRAFWSFGPGVGDTIATRLPAEGEAGGS